jgi:hypothetical protein
MPKEASKENSTTEYGISMLYHRHQMLVWTVQTRSREEVITSLNAGKQQVNFTVNIAGLLLTASRPNVEFLEI